MTTTEITTYMAQDNVKQRLIDVMGKGSAAFASALIAMVNNDPALNSTFQNNPGKFLGVALKAANYNLPIGNELGFAYIVPFKGQAQFILGYKGLIQLVKRAGQVIRLGATDVREGEIVKIDRLTGLIEFDWIIDDQERFKRKIVGYCAYLEEKNGFKRMEYMTAEEMENDYKKPGSVWSQHYEAMAKKTVLRRLLKTYATIGIDPSALESVEAEEMPNIPDDIDITTGEIENETNRA